MSEEKDWSKIAKDFDDRQDFIVGESTSRIIEKYLSEIKDLGQTLELGCGNGKYTKLIAKNADTILATDISDEMINVAKDKLKSFNNIKLECSDCYETKYNDSFFDSVFMGNLIHVILKPEKALSEAYRILKNNGRLILISFTTDGMTPENVSFLFERYLEKFGSPPKISTPMTLKSLKEMVEKCNFVVQRAELIGDDTKAMFVIASKE